MTCVLGFARTFLIGGQYRPEPLETFQAEVSRFHYVSADRLGENQAAPVSPDEVWPEAPPGWTPPSRRS